MVSRLGMMAALLAGAAALPAAAQDGKLVVAGYGGTFETTMREEVIPAFEKAHNVTVEYVAGNSTDTLAKMQAQAGAPPFDVIIVDDGPMYQAIELGMCRPIEGLPADQLYDVARYPDDKAVAVGIVATGLFYNKDYFAQQGWEPPTSWNDLKDPKYKGKIVIPPINNTYGLHTLVTFAQMNGGGEANIDPGFKTMIDEVNDNVLAYEPSPGKMTELFQSGQAVLGVWGTGRVFSFSQTGFPAAFVYPEEGAVTLLSSACPVEKPDASPLASQFVIALTTPEVQQIMVKDYGYGPVNKAVTVPDEVKDVVPGADTMASLKSIDWVTANKAREDWTKRWNREVER